MGHRGQHGWESHCASTPHKRSDIKMKRKKASELRQCLERTKCGEQNVERIKCGENKMWREQNVERTTFPRLLGHKKKDTSFRSQQNSKLTLWRVFFFFVFFCFCFFKSSESDDNLTIFSLDPTRLKTKH